MFKILFVCTGNICRSPTAEGIMRDLIKKHNLENEIMADSAGTSNWHEGEIPDFRSIECAQRHGVDLRSLRSRPLKENDFTDFDLILAMDDRNLKDIYHLFPHQFSKSDVRKILEYAPDWGDNVPDPYYQDGFDDVFLMLEDACENLLKEVKPSQN